MNEAQGIALMRKTMRDNPAPRREPVTVIPQKELMGELVQPAQKNQFPPEDLAAKQTKVEQFKKNRAEMERRHRINQLAVDLGRRYRLERVGDLDAYEVYHTDQRAMVSRLRKVLGNVVPLVKDGRGLLFFGMVGTGKDHLLAAALYQAADQGIDCRWANGQEIFGEFRDRMGSNQREEELLARFFKPTVLAISDPIPPIGDPSSWNVAQLYRILDRRYREMKSTWLSLNAVSIEDADAKLSSPVLDRLQECCELFPCFWPSYRERQRQRRNA